MFAKLGYFLSALSLFAVAAGAQVQSDAQRKCLNSLNAAGSKVAAAQAKDTLRCLKAASNGDLTGSAQACLTSDATGKVAKAQEKLTTVETKNCTVLPDFGAQSAVEVNAAARASVVNLFDDLFGGDLDASAASCDASKPGCVCQQAVVKSINAIVATAAKQFVSCKKDVLELADSEAPLGWCVDDLTLPGSVAADGKGKITKKVGKLADAIAGKCAGQTTDTLFPGKCVGRSGDSAFGICVIERVKCRVCELASNMDQLDVDCDFFDDGSDNGSCVEGLTLRSVSGGQYVTADFASTQLLANAASITSAHQFFTFEQIDTATYIRSTGSNMLWSVHPGNLIYADALDTASATAWVVFVDSDAGTLFIIRDGASGFDVDAVWRDPSTGALGLRTAPIFTVMSDTNYHFTRP